MKFQTLCAYVGAVVIVVGATVMLYAPDAYYQSERSPQMAAGAVLDAADQTKRVAKAAKP